MHFDGLKCKCVELRKTEVDLISNNPLQENFTLNSCFDFEFR